MITNSYLSYLIKISEDHLLRIYKVDGLFLIKFKILFFARVAQLVRVFSS